MRLWFQKKKKGKRKIFFPIAEARGDKDGGDGGWE